MGDHESAAMWGIYLQSNEGVAIQSTYQRLREVLEPAAEKVHLGKVRYLDFEAEPLQTSNMYGALTCKRKSFEFEAELRAAVVNMQLSPDNQKLDYARPAWEHGLSIAIDLETLIERVHVSPSAPHLVF
jgi:hypothetical protein